MNYTHKAIQLAVEKGDWLKDIGFIYSGEDLIAREVYFQSFTGGNLHNHTLRFSDILLNGVWWQALGKALGWGNCENCGNSGEEVVGENRVSMDMAIDAGDRSLEGQFHSYATAPCSDCKMQMDWQYHWHRFIDHLAEGKDTDDFFKDLLNERNH